MAMSSDKEQPISEFLLGQFGVGGFMYKCRHRDFDEAEGRKLIENLDKIDVSNLPEDDKKQFVLSVYELPFLLAAWRQMCVEHGASSKDYSSVMLDVRRVVNDKIAEAMAVTGSRDAAAGV